jgi:hypothetical protein
VRIGFAVAFVLLVPVLAGCPGHVPPNPSDTTAPELTLDAYGIPVQPGASSSPNPETINTQCCDVLRLVKPGNIDLFAGASDAESGIRVVQVWTSDERTTCEDATGTGSNTGPGGSGVASENRSGSTTGLPSPLIAQYRFVVRQRTASCVRFLYQAIVFARAENGAGLASQTKRSTFRYAFP